MVIDDEAPGTPELLVTSTGVEVRDAETAQAEAQAQARKSRLPAGLTVEKARTFPVPDRRHWLSLVYGAVVVRRGRGWREPVGDRITVIGNPEREGKTAMLARKIILADGAEVDLEGT